MIYFRDSTDLDKTCLDKSANTLIDITNCSENESANDDVNSLPETVNATK